MCVVSSSGGSHRGHLAVVALTALDLTVLPALPQVLCLGITSLMLPCLVLARLPGAVLLPPDRGRRLRLPQKKRGSACSSIILSLSCAKMYAPLASPALQLTGAIYEPMQLTHPTEDLPGKIK